MHFIIWEAFALNRTCLCSSGRQERKKKKNHDYQIRARLWCTSWKEKKKAIRIYLRTLISCCFWHRRPWCHHHHHFNPPTQQHTVSLTIKVTEKGKRRLCRHSRLERRRRDGFPPPHTREEGRKSRRNWRSKRSAARRKALGRKEEDGGEKDVFFLAPSESNWNTKTEHFNLNWKIKLRVWKKPALQVFILKKYIVSEPPAFMRLCHRFTISAKGPREKGAGGLEIKSGKKKKRRRRRRRRRRTKGGREGSWFSSSFFKGNFRGKNKSGFVVRGIAKQKSFFLILESFFLILENVYLENVYSPCFWHGMYLGGNSPF